MTVKVCKHILMIVLPLFLAACVATSVADRPTAGGNSEGSEWNEPEEYLVHNTLIDQKYIRDDVRLIVISDLTLADTMEHDRLSTTLGVVSNRLNITEQDLLNDFLMKNQQSWILKSQFNIKAKHVLVSEEEKSRFSEGGNFWGAFEEKYPNAQGILSLSRVAFNHTKDRALVYIGNKGSASSGAGYYVLLVKKDNKWVIQDEIMAWVV